MSTAKHTGGGDRRSSRAAERSARSSDRGQDVARATVEERLAAGRALRQKVPRSAHGSWAPAARRADPIELLQHSDHGRVGELLPIRYGRMKKSPFAFYRGSAAIMAADLPHSPVTGLRVQACGDCHIANFGGFGSPERRLVFDINDFDETLPAPWEWDVKRMAASVVLSGRNLGLRKGDCSDAARLSAQSYRCRMREYAQMRALEVWYSHHDAEIFIDEAKSKQSKRMWMAAEREAFRETAEHVFPKITDVNKGHRRIVDQPPLVYHPRGFKRSSRLIEDLFRRYRLTLPEEKRVILDRYEIVDIARKVVGVGSVGTRCAAMLLMAAKDDPLFLQFKEANRSVLEPYAGPSRYDNHGQRVVTGQRMLQSASDVFLGWTRDDEGHDYYFRQLRDMKMKIDLDRMSKSEWLEYVEICGWALARAHARTGDPARIAGYLGKGDAFDEAIAKFAATYADQTERDYGELLKAIRAGKIRAETQ
jgi:uncharacterized protein (DUF2252 family)